MPELAEFHAQLITALRNAGIGSVNKLVPLVRPSIPRNRLYDLCHGRELARRDEVHGLARTLSVPPGHLMHAWEQARTALERRKLLEMSARNAAQASWDDLPLPTGILLDLLTAQHGVSDTFPYRLLGVAPPPASRLYVKPVLQPAAAPEHREKDDPASRGHVPLEVPLGKHEHLLIVGNPGYGKSMLGRSLVRQLSGRWLRKGEPAPTAEAVVPLYVPATRIPPSGSWSGRLAAAVQHNGYLVAEPEPMLFAERVHGVRWIIVIDGLDEIHDRDRRLELLHVLHQRILQPGPYRLVITSRPLPHGELELLRTSHLGEYSLQPFGSDQLTEFARNWFQAQGTKRVDVEVDRFIEHVDESHLGEFIQVPLLATITAAMQTTSPDRPLPATQVELYERFVDELLHARRPTVQSHGDNAAWRSWLDDSREALLSHLARVHLDSQTRLVPAAQRWVDQRRPADLRPPRDGDWHIEQMLIDTGLVTFTGGALRFIHQSIVEYLAACHYAERAGASFQGMQGWVEQALERSTSGNLALFTLAIWSRKEANDGGLVIRRLLAEGPRAMETLVRLITIGAKLDPDLEKAVVDGIIDLFHERRSGDKWGDLVAQVGKLPTLAYRLKELIGSETLPFDCRVQAAAAFAWAVDKASGKHMLCELARSSGPTGRLTVFYELEALDHERDELADLARSIVSDSKSSRWTQVTAAYAMVRCGQVDGMAELVIKVAKGSVITDAEFVRAAEFLLEHHGRLYARQIMEMMAEHRYTQLWRLGDLATAMNDATAQAELAELAQYVLKHPDADSQDDLLCDVVREWSRSASRSGGGRQVEDAIRSARQLSATTRAFLAREVYRAGLPDEAASLLKELVPAFAGDRDSFWLKWIPETLLEIDHAQHLTYVVETAGDLALVSIPKLIDLLVKAGDAGTVVDCARRLLAEPVATQDHRLAAVDAWLRADSTAAAAALSVVRDLRPVPAERLGHADRMSRYGAMGAAQALALDVLADPVASKAHMLGALKIVLRTGRRDEVAAAIATLRANQRCTAYERAWIATELCAMDDSVTARELWLDVLVAADISLETRVRAAEELRSVGAVNQGCVMIETAAQRPRLTNAEANHLARLRQWLTC